MAENDKASKVPAKRARRAPRTPPPPPPAPHHDRIPPPTAPLLRFPPAPPRSYPPPPPPTDVPYDPVEQSACAESVSEPPAPTKSEGRPQGARRKVPSTVPVPPPMPKDTPDRSRVLMTPHGRDTPNPNAHRNAAEFEGPRRGYIRTFFSKAKEYLLKKGYLPLERHDSEVYTPEVPDMLKKYTPLEDVAYRITPPRDILKDSGAFSKLLTKGHTSTDEVMSDPESELETSADNLGCEKDEPEDAKSDVHPLETSWSESDVLSDHGSMCSECEDDVEPTPLATDQFAEGTDEKEERGLRER